MQQLLAIGIGGFFGAIARHGCNLALKRYQDFPWATFSANLVGCLLIGIVVGLVLDRRLTSEVGTSLVLTGFLGSLTTFSTFSLQTLELIQANRVPAALLNIALNVILGLGAVWVGLKLIR